MHAVNPLIVVASIGTFAVIATLLPVHAEGPRYEDCWSKSNQITRREAVCRIKWKIEHSEGIDAEHLLRETSNLLPGHVFDAVDALNEARAECEYTAIKEFSLSRSDVSLPELLGWYTGEPLDDRDFIRLNNLPNGEALGDALHQCQTAYWEDAQKVVQDSKRGPGIE
jgi:hypothetical protein